MKKIIFAAISFIPTVAFAAGTPFQKPTHRFDDFMNFVNQFVPHLTVLAFIGGGLGLMFPRVMPNVQPSTWKGVIIGSLIIGGADGIASWLTS